MEWPDAAGDYCATANAEVRSTIAWRYWYMLWKYRSTNRTLQNVSESGSTSGTTDSSSDTSDSSDWKKRLRSTWKWEEIFDSLLFTIRIPWNMQGIRTWWPKTWKTIIHSSKIDDVQLDNKYCFESIMYVPKNRPVVAVKGCRSSCRSLASGLQAAVRPAILLGISFIKKGTYEPHT